MTAKMKISNSNKNGLYVAMASIPVLLLFLSFMSPTYAEGFKFYSKSRSGSVLITTSLYDNNNINGTYEDISDLSPIQVNPDQAKNYLIILNAPDTWNNTAGAGVRFAINIDAQVVADGVFTNSNAGQQSIPITIVTLQTLLPGTHVIKGQWATQDGGGGFLGGWSETTLTVIEIPADAESNLSSRGGSVLVTTSLYDNNNINGTYEDISDLSSIEVFPDQTKDYLIILNAPDTWNNTAGAGVRFAITIDGQVVADGVYTNNNAGQQSMPITIVTVQRLLPGTHVIKGQWATQDGGGGFLGGWSETTLTVIEIPADAESNLSSRSGSVLVTTSLYDNSNINGSYEDINDLSSIQVIPDKEKDYLIILNAPDTWNHTPGAGVRFAINIDGQVVADGVYSNSNAGQQSMPITIVTLQRLLPGTHTIKGQWAIQDGGGGFLGGWSGTNLIVVEAEGSITESPGCPGSTAIDLTLNQTTFQPGHSLNIDLNITNTSAARNTDLKIWFEVPGLGLISYMNSPNYSLSSCMNYSSRSFISIPMIADFPSGTYKVGTRLINAITGEEISKDIETFTFSATQ